MNSTPRLKGRGVLAVPPLFPTLRTCAAHTRRARVLNVGISASDGGRPAQWARFTAIAWAANGALSVDAYLAGPASPVSRFGPKLPGPFTCRATAGLSPFPALWRLAFQATLPDPRFNSSSIVPRNVGRACRTVNRGRTSVSKARGLVESSAKPHAVQYPSRWRPYQAALNPSRLPGRLQ